MCKFQCYKLLRDLYRCTLILLSIHAYHYFCMYSFVFVLNKTNLILLSSALLQGHFSFLHILIYKRSPMLPQSHLCHHSGTLYMHNAIICVNLNAHENNFTKDWELMNSFLFLCIPQTPFISSSLDLQLFVHCFHLGYCCTF